MKSFVSTALCAAFVCIEFTTSTLAEPIGRQRMMGISSANASSLTICSGYSCARRPRLKLTSRQLKYVDRTMAKISSAESERNAISKLIAWKERTAQRMLGVPRDNAKATGFDLGLGQMDCIDESTNTISFLQLLKARGLLKHHKIRGYRDRGFIIDGRLPHTTAVVTSSDGTSWAIDSWYRAGGEPPVIVPLKTWLKLNDQSY